MVLMAVSSGRGEAGNGGATRRPELGEGCGEERVGGGGPRAPKRRRRDDGSGAARRRTSSSEAAVAALRSLCGGVFDRSGSVGGRKEGEVAARASKEAFFVVPVESLRTRPLLHQTNWIGYVAVATDESKAALGRRDIVVAWRGTVERAEWLDNLLGVLLCGKFPKQVLGPSADQDFPDAKVHDGFLSVYSDEGKSPETNKVITPSARHEVLAELETQMEKYKDEETSITVTGHSLGAALATLNAVDIVANGYNVSPSTLLGSPVTAILFASPHVGNDKFKAAFDSFPDLQSLHVRNAQDIVPLLPFPMPKIWYVHAVTKTLEIDTSRSPYLRPRGFWTYIPDTFRSHNLEVYLHGLAGDHGAGKKFKLVVDRDLALVNKSTNALKDEYQVPPNWWVTANCKYKDDNGVIARFKLHSFQLGE
uniref:Uncharacterized protein n=1 Tax=Avena sativa TaxID=4498 RepID=A0ACD5U071_AVESA